MTLAEILKQNGVAEDTIRTIQNDMKTAKLFTTGEENADIRLGKLKGEHESVRQAEDCRPRNRQGRTQRQPREDGRDAQAA